MRTWFCLLAPALLFAQVNVPFERIRDADKEPGNWLTYSGAYNSWRYSRLNQITTANVNGLSITYAGGAAAVEAALKSCSQSDRDCHLYAIGNFRVADEQ